MLVRVQSGTPIKEIEMHFDLDEEDKIKFEKWNAVCKKKGCIAKDTSAIGGRLTYSFTPTGLATITTIKCRICKRELDLTPDPSTW